MRSSRSKAASSSDRTEKGIGVYRRSKEKRITAGRVDSDHLKTHHSTGISLGVCEVSEKP